MEWDICTYMQTLTYAHTHIQRERERERESNINLSVICCSQPNGYTI